MLNKVFDLIRFSVPFPGVPPEQLTMITTNGREKIRYMKVKIIKILNSGILL